MAHHLEVEGNGTVEDVGVNCSSADEVSIEEAEKLMVSG